MRLLRLARILGIGLRFGLEEFFLGHERVRLHVGIGESAPDVRRFEIEVRLLREDGVHPVGSDREPCSSSRESL